MGNGSGRGDGRLVARVQRLFQTVLTTRPGPSGDIAGPEATATTRWRTSDPAEVAAAVTAHLTQRGYRGAAADGVRALIEDLHAGRARPVPEAVRAGIADYFQVPGSYFTDDAQAEAIDSVLLVTAFAQLGVAGMRICRARAQPTATTNTLLARVLDSALRAQ